MRALAVGATAVLASGALLAFVTSAFADQIHGVEVGTTVLLKERTQTSNCTLSPNPDRQCSPGAYYSGLTKKRICADDFRTDPIRLVPQSEKDAVEQEYGMPLMKYGKTLEIDHIVSLELGGSNDIANLFPEKRDVSPGYKVKDKLVNKLHDLVCDGKRQLRVTQRKIASDWQALYKSVFGVAPTG
jgi:hypothetical protein